MIGFKGSNGKLAKTIAAKQHSILPYSETIQKIEVTRLPSGDIAEPPDYIHREQQRVIDTLRERYGVVDESQITWVMVNKSGSAAVG